MKDLKEMALRGGLVRVFAQASRFVLRTGSLVVLARLLTLNNFGLVGMVTAVTGFFAIIKDTGLATVTVRRFTITDEQVSSLSWLKRLEI